jgi:drug/metabolite transporter (DMT)-like permease
MPAPPDRRLRYVAAALGLFLVWSNSFVAASFLLGREHGPARLDFVSLTVARFALIGPLCLAWSFLARRRVSLELLKRFPVRLPVAGLLSVPAYNLALFAGQQLGIPVPVASLTTALTPLFVMLLAAAVLGEALSPRKAIAFLVALSGLVVIALSRGGERGLASYPALLALTALAPLSWSIYSILSQPITRHAAPLDWTFLSIGLGSLPLLAVAPWRGGPELRALDAPGWGALLYLSLLCSLAGYAVWSWLLQHLPASSVGFFTFLNPPLAALSKLTLVALFPAVFVWHLARAELLGGGLALAGLAIVVWPRRRRLAAKSATT